MTTFSTSRQLPVPPSAVFAAIQDAKRLAAWWGPKGFSNEFDVFEFRVGGRWVFTMVGPDGARYPNESEFARIEADQLVVIRHVCQPHFQLAITLEATSGGTLLKWDQTFDEPSVAQAIAHIVVPANEQNLDRLTSELGVAR